MSDIGSAAGGNRVLLLRSLNFHTSPEEIIARLGEEIARMVGKQGREKEAEAAVCRVALIVDAQTKSRWGYAFVELITAEVSYTLRGVAFRAHVQLASALLAFLISPETQPNGFVIHDYLVAAMFMRPEAFQPVAAGLLGGENLVQATRRGGIGSTTIDKPDGKWVGYWHEQAGVVIASPKNAPPIEEDGSVKVPTGLRGYLGSLAGPPPGQQAGAGTAQGSTTSAPVSISMTAMQPIKIGVGAAGGKKRGVEEEGFVAAPPKNLLGEDDDEPEPMADSVLKSRSGLWLPRRIGQVADVQPRA
jgi:RNA-binding protein 5/10